MVAQTVYEDEWIIKVGNEATISIEQLAQFMQPWALIQSVHLIERGGR
jgi:hypothetical protein